MNQLYRAIHMPTNRLIKKIKGHKEKYVICIRKIEDKNNILTENVPIGFKSLFYDELCWYADPILQECFGITALFMEQFDLKTNRGSIACSILKNNSFCKPITIIKESFHMSFPLTFLWNDEMYMIPETSADHSVRLYKAEKFPFNWKLVKRFKTNMPLVDSTVLKIYQDKLMVLASEPDRKNGLKVKFVKYFICVNDGKFNFEYDEEYNCKQEFNYKNRNAGKIIENSNNIILPTQESTKVDYGFCLNFRKISIENDIVTFGDSVRRVAPKDIEIDSIDEKDMIGIHTYANVGKYEIIDLRYLN